MQELIDAARELNDSINMIEGDELTVNERVKLTLLNKEITEIVMQMNKLRQWML